MLISLFRALKEKVAIFFYNDLSLENYLRNKGYQIGHGNRIYEKDLAGEPYLVRIGNHCTITEGVRLITHDGGAWVFRQEIPDLHVFGKIEIKDNCFIGVNSIILPNVTIGPNAVVGAGSIVTKDVPPNTVVAGSPAKVICSLDEYKAKSVERWKKIGLRGLRETWERQLKDYFWGSDKIGEGQC
jgi:acetyltransferase-like isoleucine patch superfamily enzyme